MKILLRSPTSAAILLAVLALLPGVAAAQALDKRCGNPFSNGNVGPYDYDNPYSRANEIPVVERYHFNSDVENLIRGQSSAQIMGDLDYVLRAVPNHHRALASLMRYAPKRSPRDQQFFATECYFSRAVVFRPDNATVHMIYGVYLAKSRNYPAAEKEYLAAVELSPKYAEAHYNLGLLYVKNGQLELAHESAQKAYELGFPLQGLKRKLRDAGIWKGD